MIQRRAIWLRYTPRRPNRVAGLSSFGASRFGQSGEGSLRPIADVRRSVHSFRMAIHSHLFSAGLALLLSAPSVIARETGPQVPIAAGPLESIIEVVRAADRCGITQLRIQLENASSVSQRARLFLASSPEEESEAYACLSDWAASQWRRLNLDRSASAILQRNDLD